MGMGMLTSLHDALLHASTLSFCYRSSSLKAVSGAKQFALDRKHFKSSLLLFALGSKQSMP
jgi:hypothetical protein